MENALPGRGLIIQDRPSSVTLDDFGWTTMTCYWPFMYIVYIGVEFESGRNIALNSDPGA